MFSLIKFHTCSLDVTGKCGKLIITRSRLPGDGIVRSRRLYPTGSLASAIMSALRDLVRGSGCAPDAGQPSSNPLSALFSGLLDSTRKHERLAEMRMPDLHITVQDRDKIASRTGVVTRHLFPGARTHAKLYWSRWAVSHSEG